MIICILLALLLLAAALFLFMGKGKSLIAGYNTASSEERARYDEKKLCRAVGAILTVCAGLLFAVAVFIYRAERGLADGPALLNFIVLFLLLLTASVVGGLIYINKCAKK